MGFKKLGLAITFSPNAVSLLKTAKRMKNSYAAELCLIHVGENSESSEAKMKELLSAAGIEENSVDLVWKKGDPAKEIINICDENNIDLLIAGALEKESMLKYYIGSVARTIMRETHCSILILTHPDDTPEPFKKCCALVEYSELGEQAIKTAHEFAKLEHSDELVLIKEFQIPGLAVTISESGSTEEAEQKRSDWQNEEEMKLKVFANEMNISDVNFKTVCVYGKQGWAASSFVSENNGDILVVPSPASKLRLFDRIFQHDLEFILKQLPCALLIVRESN